MPKNSSKGGGSGPTPNDQRSNVLNPNNPAYKAAQDNYANQMNSTHQAYNSSRTGQPISPEAPRSPNDQRSVTLNPNNPAYKAAQDNHANQLNSTHPAYASSRGETDDDDQE